MATNMRDPLWRSIGRVICAISVVRIAMTEPGTNLRCDEVNALELSTASQIAARIMLGLVCGISFKTLDLFAEHGMRGRWWGWIAVMLATLGSFTFILLYIFEPSWVVAEIIFHGIVRGKCDNPVHATVAVILLSGLTQIPLCNVVNWNASIFYIAAGLLFERFNKLVLHGEDTWGNQFRVDKIMVCVVSPSFAAVAWSEQVGYALTKVFATHTSWYVQ